MQQHKIFEKQEGDAWFKRNKYALIPCDAKDGCINMPKLDWPTIFIKGLKFKQALEIGCANGWRLASIKRKGAKLSGTDISKLAIKDGKERFKGIRLSVAPSHKQPFKDQSFDLIIISYVFHWIDRDFLLRTVSEIDRLLKPDGWLIINDFYSPEPISKPYHHKKGAFTYKQDYAKIFTDTGMYLEMKKSDYNHDDPKTISFSTNNWGTCFLLRKKMD